MPDPIDQRATEKGQARARSTAVWDARFCRKDYWDYLMTIIPPDAIGAPGVNDSVIYETCGVLKIRV